ncbi:multicopper oxidase domain-containing protein [Intrasporangium sp. YIM S08009]|uniref:multicopper oxidase domain-containing protein n=1 Tax=Intrasporangium zincisolvens TaxID=3080018 RepID=UPI002B0520AD|nr:multicopper oxidase domain-containing protein [Intrasporangium sp. YIM S08009]
MTTRTRAPRVLIRSLATGGLLTAAWLLLGPAGSAHAADRSIDLWAVSGSTSLPGLASPLTVWGYSSDGSAVTAPGGPVLTVDEHDTVTITLHNTLSENTALHIGGQSLVPDTTGIPSGTRTYTFTADRPGTYLYEAGLTPNSEHQVAMGLYGALVVRATNPAQAYDDAGTAFDASAPVVLGEIDPALNASANPAGFDLRNFKPRYFTVNGKVHPQNAPIAAASGQTLLLRYVNAGLSYRSMGVLGASQRLVGVDGSQLRNGATDISRTYVAETFGPGQTADALVSLPATATDRRLAVYDASLTLHNSNTAGAGGMLAVVAVAGTGVAAPDSAGPATTGVAWASGTLTATVSDVATGGSAVTAAEYRLDSVAATATAMSGSFGTPTVTVTAPVAIASGQHVVYVRGRDAGGSWGPWSSVLVTGNDVVGPTTSGVVLAPERTNGSVAVAVSATGNDSASGGHAIGAAQLSIDGGTPAAMTVATSGPVASVTGTIPAATVNLLAEGSHTVSVRTQDSVGNWGDPATATLVVDKTGPTASAVGVDPDPNNGLQPVNGATPSVRLSATLTDPASTVGAAQSTVVAGEAFVDTLGPLGSGIPVEASDGAWSGPMENVYLDIPLATVRQMTEGSHTLWVRGRDAAGNWGAAGQVVLHVDKTAPSIVTLTATPNAATNTVTVSGTATDARSALTNVEWFRGADPGVGNGTALSITAAGAISGTIDTSGFPDAAATLSFRVRDAAGNWSAVVTRTVTVTHQLRYSTAGNTNPPGVAGTADDSDIYLFNGASHSRLHDLTTMGVPTAANVDGYSREDDTHFYVSFTGPTTVTGFGTVQDEDVLYRNGATWQMYYDGSTHGITANVDAISVTGTGTGRVLYFSLATNTTPSGVTGAAGDDADIYRWTSGSTYTRALDATTVGIPATANVDGVTWVSATDYYLSFSADAAITGLGTAADEDVIHRTGTTWSTYFDGSLHGMTNSNLDVDAFDIR